MSRHDHRVQTPRSRRDIAVLLRSSTPPEVDAALVSRAAAVARASAPGSPSPVAPLASRLRIAGVVLAVTASTAGIALAAQSVFAPGPEPTDLPPVSEPVDPPAGGTTVVVEPETEEVPRRLPEDDDTDRADRQDGDGPAQSSEPKDGGVREETTDGPGSRDGSSEADRDQDGDHEGSTREPADEPEADEPAGESQESDEPGDDNPEDTDSGADTDDLGDSESGTEPDDATAVDPERDSVDGAESSND